MKRITSQAVSLIFLFIAVAIITSDFSAMQAKAQNSPRPLAVVRRFIPTVELYSMDKLPVVLNAEDGNEQLFNGDTLKTDKKGYALVIFMDNTIAKVKPESILIVRGEEKTTDKNSTRRIDLEKGEIFLEVEPQGSGSFDVATTRSVASVKGTKFGGSHLGYVWVSEGQVDVTATNSGETVSLFQQMYASVDASGNTIETGTLSTDQVQNLQDGFTSLDEDFVEKEIIIRFRDVNGQIREVRLNVFEKGN